MGGKIDKSINRGNANYTFRLGGENYHSIGSLLPLDGNEPQFAQLYIYDTENEISNRQRVFGESSSDAENYENYIINYLKEMLDSQNPLVQAYRMVCDTFKENPQIDFKLRIIGTRKYDVRTYNLPTASEVAALIVGDIGDAMDKRDIIVNSRYLSACKAAWRIFAFDVHYMVPAVTRLPFHLPGQQQVIYGPEEDIEDVLTKTSNSVSMFTGRMEANRNYEHVKRLSYAEFPTQFVWKKTSPPKWVERQSGFAIGRIHAVPASFDEAYYLRILLNKVKGPKCFEDIRTVDGFVCDSFRDACYRRGLLDDDKEYIEAIEEAGHTANGYYLRNLFATMLITSSLSRPDYVWDNTWFFFFSGLSLSDEQLKNLALLQIEEFLVSNNSSLCRFSHIPFPDQESVSTSMNPLIMEELSYDKDSLSNDFKLFGISSLLLEGGRTAHSRFLIPINLTKDSQCQVNGNTDDFELLKKTSLIIWDEAPMIHKHAFEVLDRTLKDVMNVDLGNTSGSLFGGKVVVLGGDFRQILPVVQNGTRNDCVNATISSSYIWSNCKVLKLTKNMRLIVGSQMSNTLEIKQFADWLLDIGQGNLGGPNDGEATISIPENLLIKDSLDPMSDLIDFVYPSMLDRFNDLTYFQE
ncbi:uncharacterized protein LOC143529741 [Bidens hawaiensis]|uniref:uncharacterized protein LOC143529741 n=1 Tax=Bidens hawaiensis TaxID=980011 RepID=UPI00404A4E61